MPTFMYIKRSLALEVILFSEARPRISFAFVKNKAALIVMFRRVTDQEWS